jgi:hypothetical protein
LPPPRRQARRFLVGNAEGQFDLVASHEWPARGNAGHQKRRHFIHSAIMITAGAEPEGAGWWSTDDLWLHALHAVIIFMRATAERRQMTVADICNLLRQGR